MSVSSARPPAPTDQRKLAMAASLAVAVLMLVGKLAAYVITGSTAILSDALESVIHLFATAIAAGSAANASVRGVWRRHRAYESFALECRRKI